MKASILLISTLFLVVSNFASAHCQVPCGIFGDELKFGEFEQHVETMAKAATQIRELSAKKELTAHDHQQLIRWVNTKEGHAQKMIDETANYFLAQRVKVGADNYSEKIELLHHIIVHAMKVKQSVEPKATDALSGKIAAFKKLYLVHECSCGSGQKHKH